MSRIKNLLPDDDLVLTYESKINSPGSHSVVQSRYWYCPFYDSDDEQSFIIDVACALETKLEKALEEENDHAKTFLKFVMKIADFAMCTDNEVCRKLVDDAFLFATKEKRGYGRYNSFSNAIFEIQPEVQKLIAQSLEDLPF